MSKVVQKGLISLAGMALVLCLGACGNGAAGQATPAAQTVQEQEPSDTENPQADDGSDEEADGAPVDDATDASDEGDVVVAPDGTVAPPGTVIEDDFAPDSLPVSEGDEVTLAGTLAYETYEHKGLVECLVLVLDQPFDALFGTYPHENEPQLHEQVTCVDVSWLLYDGICDASMDGRHVQVHGTFAGSSKFSGAHYDQDGAFQINGGCTLQDPVLLDPSA